MSNLPLLQFRPTFRRYLWGGRRLQTILGKPLPPGNDYAESWEIVDHGSDQSVVIDGPWRGKTLHWLVQHQGESLLGRAASGCPFPLLFKFLDAHQNLSVQVHPSDRDAAQLAPPDLGKTEAWVVLHADEGSLIYAGLQEGVSREAFERAVREGATESCVHRFRPQVGDCVFIPAGAVHALGKGLVVAEIQQSSDTTFRLFDWNRLGSDGTPRALHIEQALEVIDFSLGPIQSQIPQSTDRPGIQRLVECDKFVMERGRIKSPVEVGNDGRFHLLAVLEGRLGLTSSQGEVHLKWGQSALLPASAPRQRLIPSGRAVFLDMFLP